MRTRRAVSAAMLAMLFVACGGGGEDVATVEPPSDFRYASNPAVYVLGTRITPNVPSSGGGIVVSYAVSPALPAGLSLNTVTGAIGGSPTSVAAAASYTVTATNASGSTTAILTVTVMDHSSPPSNVRYATNPAFYAAGRPIAPNAPVADGGIAEVWSVSPPLPAGLALDPATGVITGTPTAVAIASGFTITATNAAGSASTVVVIAVTAASTPYYSVGGSVTGLVGAGLMLQVNGGEVVVPPPGTGTFAFPTRLPAGSAYSVSVVTQPVSPWQTCRVTGGSGTVGGADVTGVAVSCTTNQYEVSGIVLGLQGNGLVLSTPGQAPLAVAAGSTTFTFPAGVASGGSYAVSVASQPSGPTQVCSVGAGTGVVSGSSVTGVVVNCSMSEFLVGGTVNGLVGDGLVLALHGEPDISIPAGATSFAFAGAVLSGSSFAVTVKAQPTHPTQTCAVANGSGMVGGAAVTNVAVSCSTNLYALSGTVTGMVGTGLQLSTLGLPAVTVPVGATSFSFGNLPSGTVYNVTVDAQPSHPTQTCVVTGGNGAIGSANVPGITVTCATNRYALGGAVTGLAGAGLVLSSPGLPDLAVPAGSSSFSFAGGIASGGSYSVTVKTQPANPAQACTVTNGTGTANIADVLDVVVTCTTNLYRVGGTIAGLSGVGLVLATAGQSDLEISSSATSFSFDAPVPQGSAYAVTVKAQPDGPAQTCTVTGASGNVGAANVTTVAVACTTNTHALRGTVSGLVGTGMQLSTPGAAPLLVPAGAMTFRFASIPNGSAYAVTVAAQPMGPSQTCQVACGEGIMPDAEVTDVSVTCTTDSYVLAGTITGLTGAGLQLTSAGLSGQTVAAGATGFSFGTVPSGTPYDVRVAVQPTNPAQTCTVSGGTGTITTGAVSSVVVTCR
jgi:large repetitive protein